MKLRLFIWPAAHVHGQCEVRPLHESCCEVVRWSAEKVARMMTAIQRWAMACPNQSITITTPYTYHCIERIRKQMQLHRAIDDKVFKDASTIP